MWTTQIVTALNSRIAQEAEAALRRKDFARLGMVSNVAKRLEQYHLGADVAAIEQEIEALLGRETVAAVIGAVGAPTPEPEATAPPAPESKTPDRQEQPVDAGVMSPAPPAEPVVVAAPPSETPLEPILQGLLGELREIKKNLPTKLDELPTHIERLQGVVGQIQARAPRSSEAQSASGDLALLRRLEEAQKKIAEIRRRAQSAAELKRLPELKSQEDEANALQRTLASNEFASQFSRLTGALSEQVKELIEGKEGIRVLRDKVAAKLRVYLTRARLDKDKHIETQLDDLDDLDRSGITHVPTELSDMVGQGLIADIYPKLRATLRDTSIAEAKRLLGEAKDHLKPDVLKIDAARERCETALTFVTSKHLAGMVEIQAVKADIDALLHGDIAAWEMKRANARDAYTQATNENDAMKALAALDRARREFPLLEGLPAERTRWLNTLWLTLSADVKAALQKAVQSANIREYTPALNILTRAQTQFDQLATAIKDDWRRLDPPHDVSELTKNLDTKREELLKEQSAWFEFKRRLDDLRRRGPGATGADFEGWWQAQEKRFAPEELTWFAREWAGLKTELAERAGDDAMYANAQANSDANPLDPALGEQLEKIIRTGGTQSAAARQLLNRHRAYVALDRARRLLCSEIQPTPPNTWLTEAQTLALQARNLIGAENEPALLSEADALGDATRRLLAIEGEFNTRCQRQEYQAAADYLQQQEGRLGEQLPYVAMGLATLRASLRRAWRQARMKVIESLIVMGPAGQCEARQAPASAEARRQALAEWEQGVAYVTELERYQALTEDGDGLRAACLRQQRSIAVLSNQLGCHPNDLTEEKLAELWNRRSEINWEQLAEHLQSLTNTSYGRGLDLDRLDKLRVLALGYQVLNASIAAAVPLLQAARAQGSLRRHPVVCGMLTLRLYEQPNGKEAVQTLVKELEEIGRPAEEVTAAIRTLQQAHDFRDANNLDLAVVELEKGTAALERLEPAFAAGFATATQTTRTAWRRQLGRQLKESALKKLGDLEQADRNPGRPMQPEVADRLVAFDILRDLLQTDELLDNDTQVKDGLGRVRTRVKQARQSLRQEVQDLLETPPRRLDEVIRRGRQLESYLQVLLPSEPPTERQPSTRPAMDAALQDTKQDLEELQARLTDWDEARQAVRSTRHKLQSLLEGDWRWNQDPAQTPNKELSDLRRSLTNTVEKFGANVPPELTGLQELVNAFQQQTSQISKGFESFRPGFEGDANFNTDIDFAKVRKSLQEFQQSVEVAERNLRAKANAAGWSGSPINLERFFLLHDMYEVPIIREGMTLYVPAEPLRSVRDALARLEERRRSWQQWEGWVETTETCMNDTQDGIGTARKVMRGKLQEAVKAFATDLPAKLNELRQHLKTLPPTPRCQLAFQKARPALEDEPDPDDAPDLAQARERLKAAPRREIREAWQAYLKLEIQRMDQDLAAGKAECEQKTTALKALIESMDRHIRHFSKPTVSTREELGKLLEQAEQIDRTHGRVQSYRERYDANEKPVRR